jgi:hypothetical protein
MTNWGRVLVNVLAGQWGWGISEELALSGDWGLLRAVRAGLYAGRWIVRWVAWGCGWDGMVWFGMGELG